MKKIITTLFIAFIAVSFTGNMNSEPRGVLLEFVTGTWCQWCPCGDSAAEHILNAYPRTVVIAYHGASSDPWQVFNGSEIRSLLGFTAYPTGIIDRMNAPSNPYVTYDMWQGLVQSRYTNQPNTVINVVLASKTFNTTTRELVVTVNSTALQTLSSQYKISFVLTEDNLIYQQTGNGTCPGSPVWNHKWVVRSMLNSATGENLNTGAWNQNQMISKTLTTTLNAAWVAANCNVNVLVYKDTSAQLCFAEVQQAAMLNVVSPLGITQQGSVPADYSLSQNYPNPFNPSTHVKFTLPKDGNASFKVFDMTGQVIAVFVDGFIKAGTYNAEIDGSGWASGVYFYNLTAGSFSETKKMTLIK
jgi:hypothetical protein